MTVGNLKRIINFYEDEMEVLIQQPGDNIILYGTSVNGAFDDKFVLIPNYGYKMEVIDVPKGDKK